MQTERVTFLTTPDHKAALDAFATLNGRSVGHVVREATDRFIHAPAAGQDEYDEALEMALPDVEVAFAQMSATIQATRASIADACAAIDRALEGDAR